MTQIIVQKFLQNNAILRKSDPNSIYSSLSDQWNTKFETPVDK